MRRLPLDLLCLAAFLSHCGPAPEPVTTAQTRDEIINGTRTAPGLFPATGSLVLATPEGIGSTCTGTLIAPDVVLTAGHCVHPLFVGDNVPYFTTVVDVSRAQVSDFRRGMRKVIHPNFNPEAPVAINALGLGKWNDIALLILAAPVPNAEVALLPTPEEAKKLKVGQSVDITGYGLTRYGSEQNGVKYHAQVLLNALNPFELRIGNPVNGKVVQNCQGDSGGPAYADLGGQRIVGIVSRSTPNGLECNDGGIHTRVDAYLDWIHANAKIPCGSGLSVGCPDEDKDGVVDVRDNCPAAMNPGQENSDRDSFGDACEPDGDSDGHIDDVDNCPQASNPKQDDLDSDQAGDACDTDRDGDGVANASDNCPQLVNADQLDSNGDGFGDACKPVEPPKGCGCTAHGGAFAWMLVFALPFLQRRLRDRTRGSTAWQARIS